MIVLQKKKSQLCSIVGAGAMSVICLIARLTKSCMVAPVVDCRPEEGSSGMVNGGKIRDRKAGIVKCGWGTNLDDR